MADGGRDLMRQHYRQGRISEIIQRFKVEPKGEDRWIVRDRETGQVLPGADYDNEPFARARARLECAPHIEKLYLPDEAAARARIAIIIREQSDPEWAARMIFDYFEGAKS